MTRTQAAITAEKCDTFGNLMKLCPILEEELNLTKSMLDCAEVRKAIGLGFSETADEEIKALHKAFDEVRARVQLQDITIKKLQQVLAGVESVLTWLTKHEELIPDAPDGTPAYYMLDNALGEILKVKK